MQRAACSLIAGFALVVAVGTPRAAAGAVRYFASGGTIFTWDGVSATLGRAPAEIAPPGSVIRDVLEAGPQTLVVLGLSSSETSHGRRRHEGEARVYDTSVTPARLLRTIGYEGEPLDGIVSTNLRKAWILAYRAPDATGAQARTYIYAIDIGTGRIEDSSAPTEAIAGIAVDSETGRIYASQRDRIQTFGLQPMISAWHLRSPGPNGPLALVPGTGIVLVVRGSDLAVFDPAVSGALAAAERRARSDDATAVIHLPFQPDHLELSDDGRLALVSGPGTMVFVEPASQAMIWPDDSVVGMKNATEVHALAFPGPGHDLIAALVPSGAVTAVRTPAPQPTKALAPEPPDATAAETAPPPGASPSTAPAPGPPAAASSTPAPTAPAATAAPATAPAAGATAPAPSAPAAPPPAAAPTGSTGPPAPAPQAVQAASPESPPPAAQPPDAAAAGPATVAPGAPASPDAPPADAPKPPAILSGKLTGAAARVRAIVFYGPNNILKEYARVKPEADGTWSAPLPPPGAYRVIVVGDGSTPLPVSPGYIALKVEAGAGRSGLDFEIKPTP